MKLRVDLQDGIAPLWAGIIKAIAGGNVDVSLIVGRGTSAPIQTPPAPPNWP